MFASKTVAAHLLRGIIAAALIIWALSSQTSAPAFAAAAVMLALIAMRGCPLCWILGLVETIAASLDSGNGPLLRSRGAR